MPNDTAPAWPDMTRPGVPLNPERDGWHWLQGTAETPAALEWRFSAVGRPERGWYLHRAQHGVIYAQEMTLWRYLGPCLTPSEVAAHTAAAWLAAREACAVWHEEEEAAARSKIVGETSRIIRASLTTDAVMHKWYATQLRALTPPADAMAALEEMLEQARREEREACMRLWAAQQPPFARRVEWAINTEGAP